MRLGRIALVIGCAAIICAGFLLQESRLLAQAQGWEEVGTGSATGGGISNNAGESSRPSIGLLPDGTLCVAWDDASSGSAEIYLRCWQENTWQQLGSASATGGGISDNAGESMAPSLAISSAGVPYVAWQDTSAGDAEIYVKRWNSLAWEEVGEGSASDGGISNNTGESLSPTLAFNADGYPVVAWQDNSVGNSEVFVRQWDGESWVELGLNSAAAGGISNTAAESTSPALAISGNDIYVAWADKSDGDNEIYIRSFIDGGWTELGQDSASGGGISTNSSTSRSPAVAIDSSGNPIVAWSDNAAGNYEILVKYWDGGGWSPLGTNSASVNGISATSGNSHAPKIEVIAGLPYVAWYDKGVDDAEIYVRRLVNNSWQEVGAGSATGGGVSDNSGASGILDLRAALDGRPYLAWGDNTPGNYEIYVAQWSEPDEPSTSTPSPTPTQASTSTVTITPSSTPTATSTVSATETSVASLTPTLTATVVNNTATATAQATAVPAPTGWAVIPVVINGLLPTSTPTPTSLPTATQTSTPIPTATSTNTPVPPTMTPTQRPPTPTATRPAPTATATQSPNCHPSYPTVCIPPPPPDLNCTDIPYRNFKVVPPDPHKFDVDKDGVGCET